MWAPAFRFFVVALLAVACGGDKDSKPAAKVAEPPPALTPTVAVHYDGQQVATVQTAELTKRMSLMDALAEEFRDRTAWASVDARSEDGRRLTIPVDKYADHDPALYLGDDGAPAFGWFAETTADETKQARLSIVRVSEVFITTAEAASELDRTGGIKVSVGGAPAEPVLASKIRGLTVHRKGERGAKKESKIRGRSLRDLVGLATDVAKIKTVTVRLGDEFKTFSAEELAKDDGKNLLFRRDRRGNLIVRWLLETGQRDQFRNVQVVDVALRE